MFLQNHQFQFIFGIPKLTLCFFSFENFENISTSVIIRNSDFYWFEIKRMVSKNISVNFKIKPACQIEICPNFFKNYGVSISIDQNQRK